ncbi:alpha/beta hydrolase, putative [Talaromyces stipitatus ATCC 10500]|uniref:Alpha/beta hydrolase, putative n=1 Tax=Talaromyces stipitatus (strain ATCC 10500 / CBS 375.48 / QM 6759 / NRRL 1006) TaxID=441959 RepID=B8LXK9_TALSN|nr:alpha/beta hydrolase, putative [Talaromyces stipitatus ATCC 10500]EED24510.1 alpha/beta hydrolase, putative [Talaromyces stipitatus ATCC 10500]
MLAFSGIENTPINNTDTDRAATVDMGGITEEEGSLVLPDGTSLYTKSWKPEGIPRAIIAFYHGFSDHCNSFFDFFPNLASSGIEVRSLDQRGWGRSVISIPKLRGHYGSTSTVMADLHFFLQSLIPFTKEGTIPLFLMGHSMGGMNVLYYVLNPESPYHHQAENTNATTKVKLAGVMSVAPLVAVHPTTQPLKIVEYAGRIAKRIVPKMTMVQNIDAKWVSKNQAVVDDIKDDKGVLYHNTGTLEGLAGMLDRGAWLNDLHKKTTAANHADGKNVPPLWIGHGTEDRVTWCDATRRLAQSLDHVDDKTYKEYEGAYHKLMNEPDGVAESMTKDVTEWIEARLPKSEA